MGFKIKFTFIFLVFVLEGLFGSELEDSELALHHFMQGEFLMNQGNYSLAVLEFQDAIELDPNASTIHVSIADAYLKLGKLKDLNLIWKLLLILIRKNMKHLKYLERFILRVKIIKMPK